MSDFVQLQLNEVEALKAIYQEDFGESEREAGGGATPATAGATGKGSPWKVVPRAPEAKTYQIHLRPTIEELRGPVAVFLQFRFYKRYPDIVPELKIIKDRGVSDLQIAELQRIILAKAKELVGAEMIFEIASFIEEHLSIHNSAIRGVKQVSAYEEMVDRQRETAQVKK